MESKEIPKNSTVVACNYSGKSQPGGGDWVYWYELELENGNKGRCGVTKANEPLIQEGCTIDYQYIPHTFDQDKNPTSFKIKYLTPSSAAYKLRMASNGDGAQKNTPPHPVVNNQKPEQIQIQLGGPVAPLSNELGANITDFETQVPNNIPKDDSKNASHYQGYGQKKTNPFVNNGSKSSKEGPMTPDGRKYSYAKHPEEFLGYAWAYAKDFILGKIEIASNSPKEAQNSIPSSLKEDVENIGRVARYIYENMKQMINNTELTEELQTFKEKPTESLEPAKEPLSKKTPTPRKSNQTASSKKSAAKKKAEKEKN
jgi:hypothetical protein